MIDFKDIVVTLALGFITLGAILSLLLLMALLRLKDFLWIVFWVLVMYDVGSFVRLVFNLRVP